MSNGGVIGRRNVPWVDGTSGVWSLREIANARREGISFSSNKKHWRFYVTAATSNGDYVSAQEIEMAASVGGANICTGGAPISSGAMGGYPLSNAFDGNRGGAINQCWTSPSTTMPQWIGYSFTVDTGVAAMRWVVRNWDNLQTPKDFIIQNADDVAGPWYDIVSFSGVTYSAAGEVKEFTW